MPKPTQFIFEAYELDTKNRQILLTYSLNTGTIFTETFPLPEDLSLEASDSPDIQRALFALHLAAGISYYKTFCPPEIVVKSGQLSQAQAEFWNKFYTKGLGEFFYINKIDFRNFVKFPVSAEAPAALAPAKFPPLENVLLPFGGGKDSVVSLEILRKQKITTTLFRLRAHHFITQLADVAKTPMLTVERQLDPQLFELNASGAYNGHVPITGIVTFLGIVVSLLGNYDAIVFSNERSADYGSIEFHGMHINHQWSKGIEAEQLITKYLASFVTTRIQYLNPLRPFSELKITEIFAKYPEYFLHTTSCNQNWLMLDNHPSANAWCGKCYKCCFIFALYAAMLPEDTAIKMFGKNLFEDETLLHKYRQLWGAEGIKPFDCVGTPEETQAAMYLALQKPVFKNTFIGRDFAENIKLEKPDEMVKQILKPNFDSTPSITKELLESIL